MITCELCKREFKTYNALHTHLSRNHNYSKYEMTKYDIKYLNIIHPKCPICGKLVSLSNSSRIFNATCGDEKCKSELYKIKIDKYYNNHPEEKERKRDLRIKYLQEKQHFKNTAWGKRAANKLSYLEQWFVDKIIIPYKLYINYDIINEYPVYPYFLDFAFININLDIELDGRCHFINGNERIEHDINRDNQLNQNGWIVYRISFYDIEQNEKETIDNFINTLNTFSDLTNKLITNISITKEKPYYDYYTLKLEKQKQRENKRILNKAKYHNKMLDLFKKLENESNIDFSKFGWNKKAKLFLESLGYKTKKNGICNLIKNHYPEFFINNNVFIRKICNK